MEVMGISFMDTTQKITSFSWVQYSIVAIWICNCLLGSVLAIKEVWIPYMSANNEPYSQITSDPFDGTSLPIMYIPDWTKEENQDKSRKFEDIAIADFLPLPPYNAGELLKDTGTKESLIQRYTYITPFLGSYRLNYKEYDGSHVGIDIRAPLGTPVLSIAHGVVIRTIEKDLTGNKLVVIRHDNVPYKGKNITLYSGYLHLSQIHVTEGTKIRKGEMLGRVGMTGFATTPHLHIQIDTADAPFHPYWPFTSQESKKEGLGFYDSVNAGLGKEKALEYSIHPLQFIYENLAGGQGKTTPQQEDTNIVIVHPEGTLPSEIEIASLSVKSSDICTNKRFNDISVKSSLGKSLYELVDKKCLFTTYQGENFEGKKPVTKKDAIINLMKLYDIKPATGESHFLDIPIGDTFQGYAITAYRKGILDGSYAFPEKIITKEEFAMIASQISGTKNPSTLKIYQDVDGMNPAFSAIQNYALMVGAKGGKFYPKNILTRSTMGQMMSSLYKYSKR